MGTTKNEKLKKILVPAGVKKQLKDAFGVSYPTVRSALNGVTQSYVSHSIRESAIKEYNGVEINECHENKSYFD
jgi:hypothetical protein